MNPRRRLDGLTLIETLLLVSVVASILAVFVPTFFRHLRTSKVSEAAERLQEIYDGSAAYFVAAHPGQEGQMPLRSCLPEAAGPTPLQISSEAQVVDFIDPERGGHPTWAALGFQPEEELRYRYSFLPTTTGCALPATTEGEVAIRLRAEGDIDGDGRLSTFERDAVITEDAELAPVGALHITNRVE